MSTRWGQGWLTWLNGASVCRGHPGRRCGWLALVHVRRTALSRSDPLWS